MKMKPLAESWLYRYERSFARYLPLRGKKDIQKEFHSHILDDLDMKYGDNEVDEEVIKEYLQGLGSPRCKAQAYKDVQSLMPDEVYPVFKMVSSIVLLVLTLVLTILAGFDMAVNGITIKGFLVLVSELFTGLTSALGVLLLVFICIGRCSKNADWSELKDEEIWSPDLLPEKEYPDKFPLGETIAELVFTCVGIIIFLFFPQIIGIHSFSDGIHTMTPVLSQAFWQMLPLFMIRWFAGALFDILLIVKKQWSLPYRLTDLLLRAFSFGILIYFFRLGWDSLILSPELISAGYGSFISIGGKVFKVLMILGIFGAVLEILQKVIALYREP